MGLRRGVAGACLVVAVLAAGLAVSAVGAVTGTVVINEIFYNQAEDALGNNIGEDFIELHNPGTSDVDLTGYTIDDEGSAAAVPPTTLTLSGTLPAGGYVYISSIEPEFDAAAFWGIAPFAEMDFGLGGGGDTITVRDADGQVVDQVIYTDDPPWPGEPDGDGPSLELINALADNSVSNAWGASLGAPTPGVVNSIAGTDPPEPISSVVATPTEPAAGQDITVVANVPGETAPQLFYVVGFGAEVEVSMTDDGVAPDATANDGVFTALIPGQSAGELVRYRILSPATGEEFPDNDGRRYAGVVVDDPDELATGLVTMEWFITDESYDVMFDDPLQEISVPGSVLAIDGVVYDNVEVNIRGGSYARINHDKQGLSFDMPSGVTVNRPDMVPYPIDEFALVAERGWTFGRPFMGWEAFYAAGFPTVHSQHVRVQRNGEFYGVFRFSEKLDGEWRDANGIDGDFYKAVPPGFDPTGTGFEKKQGDGGNQPVIDLNAELSKSASAAKTDYLYDNLDIPNVVNFLAVATIVGHFDSGVQNFYLEQDAAGTGRWQVYPWDLSNLWGVNGPDCDGEETNLRCTKNELWTSVLEVPELEQMVLRRMRTIIDGPAADGNLEDQAATYMNRVSTAEAQADDAAWNAVIRYNSTGYINNEIDDRRDLLLAGAGLPSSQAAAPGIVINELHPSPNNDVEFLEVHNPTGSAVDLSGWTIEGAGLTFPPGTVIPAGGYVVGTQSLTDFPAAYPGAATVVLVEYDGGLKGGGELLELKTASGAVVDSVDYATSGEWSTDSVGGEKTLSLFDPADDNSQPASWGASDAVDGTPGAANDTVPGTIVLPPGIVITEIHYNPAEGGVEFVELFNSEIGPIDLEGFDLDGMIVFPAGTVIPAGGFLVVTENLTAFQTAYPGIAAIQWTDGGLSNGGENVTLDDADGLRVDAVEYSDSGDWPAEPDGNGPSLELIDPTLDNALFASWQASEATDGSPGMANVPVDPPVDPPGGDGPVLVVRARGVTGEELLTVRASGVAVESFGVSSSFADYVVELPVGSVIGDVAVAFTNDAVRGGFDRNLIVDFVELDGARFDTAADETFSTGTWNSGTGCDPSSVTVSETLHCNGEFTYA